ncbi:Protein sof1 [Gurleya vavrai]
MIIKVISHTEKSKNKRKNDIHTQNIQKSNEQPFAQEREYVRALNSAKIERLLAKPFIKAFNDHKEPILRVEKHIKDDLFISTSYDKSIFIYDTNKKLGEIRATDYAKGACFYQNFILYSNINHFVINSDFTNLFKNYTNNLDDDNGIKNYNDLENDYTNNLDKHDFNDNDKDQNNKNSFTKEIFIKASGYINSISGNENILISSTSGLELFNSNFIVREKFLSESCEFAVFDPSSSLIAASSGNKIIMIDNRIEKELSRNEVGCKTNYISFSPNSRYFVSANEDQNAYLHDLRYMEKPTGIFRHHVNAVTCVDFNPSGNEIVTGSYDKTLRIWKLNERKSRDVYYNRRMQGVSGVKYTNNGNILSGSEDGSLRLWRGEASLKEKISRRENEKINEAKILKEKYKDVPEINKIMKHRFLPKAIKGELKNKNEHYKATERKKKKFEKNYDEEE